MIHKRLQDKLPDPLDREALFDAMLNECYSFGGVGGPFAHMLPSAVLKAFDPTAYYCGVCDYMDNIGAIEYEGVEYDRDAFTKAVDEANDEIDSEIKDLEVEIEEKEDRLREMAEENGLDPEVETVDEALRKEIEELLTAKGALETERRELSNLI